MLRFIEPEKLSDPNIFYDTMQYLAYLNAPIAKYLPSWWLTEAINSVLLKQFGPIFINSIMIISTAVLLFILVLFLSKKLYYKGWSSGQTNSTTDKKRTYWLLNRPKITPFFALLYKDIVSFLRDTKQWSQLLLVAALVIVYLFNMYKLPVQFKLSDTKFKFQFLADFIGFINIGGTGFILSALALRFVFPQVSMERGSIWYILSIPHDLKKVLFVKFVVSATVILFLGFILIFVSNIFLKVSPVFFIISLITSCTISIGITSLALGLGTMYPKFNVENVAQIRNNIHVLHRINPSHCCTTCNIYSKIS
jgi:ABC-2 type transport system permease protein